MSVDGSCTTRQSDVLRSCPLTYLSNQNQVVVVGKAPVLTAPSSGGLEIAAAPVRWTINSPALSRWNVVLSGSVVQATDLHLVVGSIPHAVSVCLDLICDLHLDTTVVACWWIISSLRMLPFFLFLFVLSFFVCFNI